MGDRIAVMREGGHLEQYAPPAELLMRPANRFVEDFVGADRALKRLALQRVRDVDLWEAPLVRAGEPAAEARARLADSDVPYPLLVDADGRPLGWLSERALEGERVTEELRSKADPMIELDDVLRDALSDLLAEEAQYGPVVDERGAVCGVLSIELDRPRPPARTPSRCRAERMRREPPARPGGDPRPLGGPRCVSDNGFCPDWIADNFDRYVDPFFEHVLLTVVAVGDRLRDRVRPGDRRLPAPLARRPDHPGHGRAVHDPEHRGVLPAAADHRPRLRDRDDRAGRLLAPDHLPQRARRARQRARRDEGRRPRHGPHRPPAALARGGAAGAAGDPRRPAHRGDHHRRPRDARVLRRRRRPRRADLRRHQLQVERGRGGRPRRPAGRAARRG